MSFCLPAKILDQHLVMLGKTGSGKSSKLRYVVEHLLDHNKRVCVVDPKGDWWGLKVSADGKSAGYPVVLFGDFKNADARDVPINDHSGRHLAELVSSGNRPCVIGMRGWSNGSKTRFWIDFASTLFNASAGELYLVVDECHNFAPKQWKGRASKDDPIGMAIHWTNTLLSEARGLGLVCLLASQRPQKVHNDTLSGCETLAALRVTHPRDREAIQDWIDGNGDPEVGKEVLATLASMPRTDGWIWSPESGFGPKRITFPMFTTFDSFAPPQLQKRVSNKGWATVDLTAVTEKLAQVIEEEKANDPKALKAELIKARAELKKLQAAPAPKAEIKTKTVERFVLKDGQIDKLNTTVDRLQKVLVTSGELYQKAIDLRDGLAVAIKQTTQPVAVAPNISRAAAFIPKPTPAMQKPAPVIHKTAKVITDDADGDDDFELDEDEGEGDEIGGQIGKGAMRRVMIALAQYHPAEVNARKLGVLARIKKGGSTWRRVMAEARKSAWVSDGAEGLSITAEGLNALGKYKPLPTGAGLQAYWRKKFGDSTYGHVFQILLNAYPQSVDKAAMAEATGKQAGGSTMRRVLAKLRALELCEKKGLRANSELFAE